MQRNSLPIDDHLGTIRDHLERERRVIVVAPPGAGKTTRVAPSLLSRGSVILLQPRRVAARSLARRIAAEQGFTLGDEVGWQVRFERRFTAATRLLVATEGILTARLQSDPLLSDFRTAIIDELHERSLHADLALALLKQAQQARNDLWLVVMSATLDAAAISRYLDDCPVVEIDARQHPVEIAYASDVSPAVGVRQAYAGSSGHVLCFLPGVADIRRVGDALGGSLGDADVWPLHGSLAADAQDRALAPSSRRKVILATNIAETSLTVDGVTDVVDSGLAKVMRRDQAIGIDRLEVERISADAATQRAGRAGRTGPGRALRLWDERARLEPHREPEIRRVDLTHTLLEVIAWGDDPRVFDWLERPSDEAVESGCVLLRALGAIDGVRLTPLGERMRRLPMHPRLARLLIAAGGSRRAAAVCAVLSEPDFLGHDEAPTTDSDVMLRVDRLRSAPASVQRAAASFARVDVGGGGGRDDEESIRRAILQAFPDRVGQRREGSGSRLLLASGHGAALSPRSGVREGEYVVAVALRAGRRGPGSEAQIEIASRVERAWLEPTNSELVHRFDPASGKVKATERSLLGVLVLSERAARPERSEVERLLLEALRARPLDATDEHVLRRLAVAGIEVDVAQLQEHASVGARSLPRVDYTAMLSHAQRKRLNELAPERLRVPSGRQHRLDYRADGSVVLAVKLQELFGLAATPTVGSDGQPVVLELLAPNGRPVQTTADLASFWRDAYLAVRKELRGRYPKHPWPEDPWTAMPTARTKSKSS